MIISLKPSVWVPALMRRAEQAGAFAVIIHRGDPDAGSALVKVRTPDALAALYEPMRDIEGQRFWRRTMRADEAVIDGVIKQRLTRDPDLWVIEIEDREGRHFLIDSVVDEA